MEERADRLQAAGTLLRVLTMKKRRDGCRRGVQT
jgi:hypothetical protein